MPLRDARGFLRVRLIHHQARVRQPTRSVAAFDRCIDARAAAKIVAGEDESFQNTDRANTLARAPMFSRTFPFPHKA